MNILEASIDSARGRKRFEYDKTKLEKGDFVNFILVDVPEIDEETEKLEPLITNIIHGLGDNKLSQSIHPEHRNSLNMAHNSMQHGSDTERKKIKSPHNHTSSDDMDNEDNLGDDNDPATNTNFEGLRIEISNEKQNPDPDHYFNHDSGVEDQGTTPFEVHRIGMGERSSVESTPMGHMNDPHIGHIKRDSTLLGNAGRSGSFRIKKPNDTMHDKSPLSPMRRHGPMASNINFAEDDYTPQSPAYRERSKQATALEMSLDPESRAKLRIIQAIHGDRFDKNTHMSQIKEKKKIIIESDDENENPPLANKEPSNPKDGGDMISSLLPSPALSMMQKSKDRGGFVRESSMILDSVPPSGQNSPYLRSPAKSPIKGQEPSSGHSKILEKKDPIIRLADDDDEDDDRRVGGHRSKHSTPNRPKSALPKMKAASSSRFSQYLNHHAGN